MTADIADATMNHEIRGYFLMKLDTISLLRALGVCRGFVDSLPGFIHFHGKVISGSLDKGGNMKPSVVIPSYWGRSWKEPIDPQDDVYDHPTPLDETGTLERALQSFEILEDKDFDIVVLGVATNPDFRASCQEKVQKIIDKFKSKYSIALFSYPHVEAIRKRLSEKNDEELTKLVSLKGYSNVRNACLIATVLLGSEVAIFFDDDEVMRDPAYIGKALEFLGKEHQGEKVLAVAGYYLRPEGDTYLVPDPENWLSATWDGPSAMNAAFRIIGEEPRLKPTPFAFGGNMVLHRELFEKVAFDPNVTRGEDIDFLINAKMFGYNFFLDNQLYIKHLPPKSRTPGWRGFRENIYRFVYGREKLLTQRPAEGMRYVEIEELDPYPGTFLKSDLQDKVYETSVLMALDYLSRSDQEGFRQSLENIAIAKLKAKPKFDPFEWYFKYRERWNHLITFLSEDSSLKESFQKQM